MVLQDDARGPYPEISALLGLLQHKTATAATVTRDVKIQILQTALNSLDIYLPFLSLTCTSGFCDTSNPTCRLASSGCQLYRYAWVWPESQIRTLDGTTRPS